MNNHLKNQSSPYLLQHANNPVEWYPWCDEAFERAKFENKPVFLSIGYSTCHWCHVMAHESFENPKIADILNKYFISVKVDREERPDIDSVYMKVCQAFTGNGGWPMSIFMTADQEPFFAGTYFPPKSNYGMIGFGDLLLAVAQRWNDNRDSLQNTANEILLQLKNSLPKHHNEIDDHLLQEAVQTFSQDFDKKNGGFGSAPKFPMPHNLIFLSFYTQQNRDEAALKMAKKTLLSMRKGGIFDQIGYGFCRYSTDDVYLAPHFEKMLYDNALLILAYTAVYQISGEPAFLDTAEKTAQYVLREMTGPDGEFYCAQDADSDGEEGRFYLWDYKEISDILGEKNAGPFCAHFGITKSGNFHGKNIPNLLHETDSADKFTDKFQKEIQKLYQYRKARGSLHLDDKVLTSWNSLMICAMVCLSRASENTLYLTAAENACRFIEKHLTKGNTLSVSFRDQKQSVCGFLDDYAYYTAALLFLYEGTSEHAYLKRAEQICKEAQMQFADLQADGTCDGYFLYGANNHPLIAKPKETYDGALPSGNSVMAYNFVRLFQITENDLYHKAAEQQLAFLSGEAARYPAGHSVFLTALLFYQNPKRITIVLAPGDNKEHALRRITFGVQVQILDKENDAYPLKDGKTTYYMCENHTCFAPFHMH